MTNSPEDKGITMTEEISHEIEKYIQHGCFCTKTSTTISYMHQMIFHVQKNCSKIVPEAVDSLSEKEYLLACSFIEIICNLYRREVHTGKVCCALVKIVAELINDKNQLKTALKDGIFSQSAFHSFAAIKSFIEFQLTRALHLNSNEEFIGVYSELTSLLRNFDSQTLKILNMFEHSIMKLTSNSTINHDENCNFMSVIRNELDLDILYNILEENTSLPLLLKQLNESNEEWKENAVHTLLRILLLGVDNSSCVKNAFLHNSEPLFTLMVNASCGLILDRSCLLIREILDFKSTYVADSNHNEKLSMALQFLKKISLFEVFKSTTDLKEIDYFKKQPYICQNLSAIKGYFSDQNFQSILLLYLTCTSTTLLNLNLSSESIDLDVISTSLSVVEKQWKLRIANPSHPLTLFEDQDDNLIEALYNCLQIYSYLGILHKVSATVYQFFNPHFLFLSFLGLIRNDYRVLLDFLISEETSFLLYFVKYLKFLLGNFKEFCSFHDCANKSTECVSGTNCNDGVKNRTVNLVNYDISDDETESEDELQSDIEKVVTSHNVKVISNVKQNSIVYKEIFDLFLQLTHTIERQMAKNLFPYDAKPLLKLLKTFLNN
ncbi:hypothetical protein CHUAL_010531 [Chamberlinius hualienensis]